MILQNLEEAIICKTPDGLGFCNKRGIQIVRDIVQIIF